MKDIHEVLRRKQAQYAQLGKQIEMLQQAAEKLREVAPLLADSRGDRRHTADGRQSRSAILARGKACAQQHSALAVTLRWGRRLHRDDTAGTAGIEGRSGR